MNLILILFLLAGIGIGITTGINESFLNFYLIGWCIAFLAMQIMIKMTAGG